MPCIGICSRFKAIRPWEVSVTLWGRKDVKYVRFFFMLKVFIVPVVSIGYERNQGWARLGLDYWKYKEQRQLVFCELQGYYMVRIMACHDDRDKQLNNFNESKDLDHTIRKQENEIRVVWYHT